MKKTGSIRTISSALLALASSVLTDLVYGEISNAGYEMQFVDGKVILEQVNELGFGIRVLAIGIVFFATWLLLFTVRWCFPQLVKRIVYRNKHNYTKDRVYSNFVLAESILLETGRMIKAEPNTTIFYAKEIGKVVTSLYNTFCPPKKRLSRVIKATFRTGVAGDFDQRISPYEYFALIDVAEEQLTALTAASEDSMLKDDCKRLCDQLNELRSINQ